ncbi:hypothetical protein VCUG_00248 [Vavraia culicis subsp. floridensis]|uniref:Uncharacterized protein n=1 Tax=Vavraia culicis (isolate floridensis) TaxID=948595 RepID=L2GXW6_VAVCU|nr:uncharacterized protein VCUG_00248 [Vavraia culicis subsp. floridensis]ELA48207.1 hypothetical protein VCUG_00248 [Vavraia culicis subsp. floridensis]
MEEEKEIRHEDITHKEDVTRPEEFIEDNSGSELDNSVEKEDVTRPEEFIEDNSGAELENSVEKEYVTRPEEFIEENSGAELENSAEKEDVTRPEEFIEENSGAELENSVEKEDVTRPEEFIEENSGAELENSAEKEDVTRPEEFIEENSGAELENSVEKEDMTRPEEFIEDNSGAELENSVEKEDVTRPEEFIEENSRANADEQKYEDDIVVSSEGSKEEKSTNYEMEDYVKEEEHQNNAGETFEANSGEVTRSTEHECSIAEGVSETKKDDNSSLSEEHLHEETRETFPAADTIGLGRLTEDDEDFDLPDIPDELFDGYENECPDFLVSSNKNADTKNREISDEIVERRDGVGSVLAVDVHERAPANEAVEYQEGLTESRNSELPIDGQQSTEEGHRLTEQNELVDGKIRENIEQKTPSDQIEDNKNLMNLLNHDNQSKDHVFKEESFYDIDVAPKKVIKGHEIIEEMPNDLWSDEDEELETTFEKLHVKGTAEGFMEEEMSNVGKDVSGNVYQPQESKKLSIVDEKNVTESVSTNDPFARVYEHGMERSADTFRSRRENDLFTTIADRNASPEEKALESLVRKQMNIDDKIRHEDSLERLKNADINEEICQSAEKTVKPGNLFIPAVKNKPKSSFVPKVDMSLSPHKKGVKFQFLRNKLLVFTSVKQCRVNAENEKTEKMKYVERFYRIKSNQRVDAMTKSEIREKAANTTAPNNIYALLLDVRSFKGTEARMTHNPDINEIMRLSFKDQLAATMKCIERKDYGMAFLLSRGNKEAERAALDGYLRTSIDPLFHSFFSHTAEIMAPYKCEPYLHDDGRWVEFLSLILDRRNASDADMESLLEIKKSKADQFYVLVFLYLKFGKSFFHKHKDVLLTNYEFVRIMSYLKVKDIEDLKTYYEEYFLVTDKGMPVMTGGWGWKNYVEKGISKIIGIDNAFAENEVQKGTANKNVSEKTKAMNKDKLRGDEELSAKRKMNPQVEDDTNTLKDKEALFEKHIKLAKENMDKTEQKTVPDYASSFADFFVSEPMLVPDTSYDDQSLPKSVIDRDKDDENDVIIAKKEEKGWGFSLLNLFKRKEKRYKVKCGVECDFKYDPQTKRWINTKAQTSKVEKIDAQKDKVVTEKSVPLPCPVNRKTGEKKTGESIASRYVIENDGVTDEEVNANDIFGVCKKK